MRKELTMVVDELTNGSFIPNNEKEMELKKIHDYVVSHTDDPEMRKYAASYAAGMEIEDASMCRHIDAYMDFYLRDEWNSLQVLLVSVCGNN